MKIVFFGDSLTQGTTGAAYVDKVAALLRGHHFLNEGVNGDTSLNLYRRVEQDVIAHRPDGVLIMVGINDAMACAEPGSRLYYRLLKQIARGQVSPVAFRENMRALLMRLLLEPGQIWVVLPPLEYSPAAVRTLRQMNEATKTLCSALGIPTLDLMAKMTPPDIPQRPPLSMMAQARRYLLAFNPNRDYDRLRDAGGYTYSFDGIHLTEAGAQTAAQEIARFLHIHGVR